MTTARENCECCTTGTMGEDHRRIDIIERAAAELHAAVNAIEAHPALSVPPLSPPPPPPAGRTEQRPVIDGLIERSKVVALPEGTVVEYLFDGEKLVLTRRNKHGDEHALLRGNDGEWYEGSNGTITILSYPSPAQSARDVYAQVPDAHRRVGDPDTFNHLLPKPAPATAEKWATWSMDGNITLGDGLVVHVGNLVGANLESSINRHIATLTARIAEGDERIRLAGGYHMRTPREVEIEEALNETRPEDRDTADVAIGELLALVDAGRNRVHQEVELREKAESDLAAANARAEKAEAERDAALGTLLQLGEADVAAGRVHDHKDVKRELGETVTIVMPTPDAKMTPSAQPTPPAARGEVTPESIAAEVVRNWKAQPGDLPDFAGVVATAIREYLRRSPTLADEEKKP